MPELTMVQEIVFFVIVAIVVGFFVVRSDHRTEAEKKASNGNPKVKRIFQICVGGNVVDRSDEWIEFSYKNAHAVLVASENLFAEGFELSELHGKGLRVYI